MSVADATDPDGPGGEDITEAERRELLEEVSKFEEQVREVKRALRTVED